jgi:hypothetical protein
MTPAINRGVMAWHSSMRPIRLDIVGDYAGSSRFLVHGDSLLRRCFSDSRLNFATGFPMLHAVYIVERFLENMIKRKCVFDIVFFQLDQRVCIPPGRRVHPMRWLCARAAIISHLKSLGGSYGETKSFKGFLDEGFIAWVDSRKPMFIMADDGDDIDVDEEEQKERAVTHGEVFDRKMKLMIRRLMQLGEGTNIALINQVEFVDSKVHCPLANVLPKRTFQIGKTNRV